MTDELTWLDATAMAELVARGEVTPGELVAAAIARAEALNPDLNAIIHPFFEEAGTEAEGDLPDGPFRGVPFLRKDLGAALAGEPLHMGSRVLKEIDFRAPADSSLALRFRSAGLVTIGKTNTPEWGIVPTTEPEAYGPTRNPWDTGRSPRGSSGGSGAAVAAGIVPVAHANDGGGSIRIPASVNGLVGLKPSRARISEAPISGDTMSGLVCEFALTRSVRDAATLLDWVAGPEPGDPYAALPPERAYAEELGRHPGRLRIALLTDPLTDDVFAPEVVAAAERVAKKLEGLGHEVECPDLSVAGSGVDMFPTFMTRWAAGEAAMAITLGQIIGRDLTPADVEPLTWTLIEQGRRESAGEYLDAITTHQFLSRIVAGLYEGGIDLIMTPTVGRLPQPLGSYDDSGPDPMEAMVTARGFASFTGMFNATGQPAISLPLAEHDGLPVGIQFAAPIWREDVLIRLAAQLEREIPWAGRHPVPRAAGTPGGIE